MAALGACKTMTMRMYADRKKLKLDQARVTLRHEKIHATDCVECETKEGKIDETFVEIELFGDLTDEERQRIFEIAERCPVHKTLTSENRILATLKEND